VLVTQSWKQIFIISYCILYRLLMLSKAVTNHETLLNSALPNTPLDTSLQPSNYVPSKPSFEYVCL